MSFWLMALNSKGMEGLFMEVLRCWIPGVAELEGRGRLAVEDRERTYDLEDITG